MVLLQHLDLQQRLRFQSEKETPPYGREDLSKCAVTLTKQMHKLPSGITFRIRKRGTTTSEMKQEQRDAISSLALSNGFSFSETEGGGGGKKKPSLVTDRISCIYNECISHPLVLFQREQRRALSSWLALETRPPCPKAQPLLPHALLQKMQGCSTGWAPHSQPLPASCSLTVLLEARPPAFCLCPTAARRAALGARHRETLRLQCCQKLSLPTGKLIHRGRWDCKAST